jgi:hypothetical protein
MEVRNWLLNDKLASISPRRLRAGFTVTETGGRQTANVNRRQVNAGISQRRATVLGPGQ